MGAYGQCSRDEIGMKKTENKIIIYNLVVSGIMLMMINLLELREVYELMLLYSFSSAFVFALLIIHEIKYYRGLNLNLLVLMGCIMRFVLPAITKAWGAINGEVYSFLGPENDVNDYMFPTVVWMNIYYSIFYWCIIRFESKITIEDVIKPFFMKYKTARITIPLFIIGIAYNIVISFVPASFIPGVIQTLLGQLATLAIIIQLLETIFKPTRFNRLLFLTFIIVSIWQSMFYGFYKGTIMMNFVYCLLYYFLKRKYNGKRVITSRFIIGVLSLFVIIDLLIYPFMSTKRIESGWDVTMGGIATQEYSNIQILKDVISGNSKSEVGENSTSGRLDAVEPNAFFYKECCEKGLRTTKIAQNNIELLIPRFIKPDKHDSQAGLMVYAYAMTGSFDNTEMAVSNNYIGQFASAYLIGGGVMAILLAFFNGWFTIFYYNFLIKRINNILVVLLFIPFLLSAMMAFEEIHDGGALRTGYSIVMMIGIAIMTRFFPGFLTIKSKNK